MRILWPFLKGAHCIVIVVLQGKILSLLCVILFALFSGPALAESHAQKDQVLQQWHFGKGLRGGDVFEYRICDFVLRIPQSPDPCYDVSMHFLNLLPTQNGNMWVVAAGFTHGGVHKSSIFHVAEGSFKVRSEIGFIPYADSVERTLQWVMDHSSKFKPRSLGIGQSWGYVTSDSRMPAELIVSGMSQILVGDEAFDAYKIEYLLAKQSFLHISPSVPFPIKAVIHKPISTHLDAPLEFTFDLLSYSNSAPACEPPVLLPQAPLYFAQKSPDKDKTLLTPDVVLSVMGHVDSENLQSAETEGVFVSLSEEPEIREIEMLSSLHGSDFTTAGLLLSDLLQNFSGIQNMTRYDLENLFGNLTRTLSLIASITQHESYGQDGE